jgi:hypothetical protein
MHRVEIYRPGGRRNRDSNPEINIIPPVEASKLDGVSFPSDARVIRERGPNGLTQVGKIVLSRGTDIHEHEKLRRAVFSSIGSGVMSSGHIYTRIRPD